MLSAQPVNGEFSFVEQFDRHWCQDCWRKLGLGSETQCARCGASIRSNYGNPFDDGCKFCRDQNYHFENTVSLGSYGGLLQRLIIRMKNGHDDQLAIQLGQLLAYAIVQRPLCGVIDKVVPVPTHWQRRLKRGFCAAEILAETIGAICKLPTATHLVQATRSTRKQGTLSMAGRRDNVKNAFSHQKRFPVEGKHILIVDDVMTSGSTTSEVAKVLKKAGAAKVYVAVVARGTGAQ